MSLGIDYLAKALLEGRIRELGKVNPLLFTKEEKKVLDGIHRFINQYGQLPKALKMESDTSGPYQYYYDELVKRSIRTTFAEESIKLNKHFADGEELEALALMKALVAQFDLDVGGKDVLTLSELAENTLTHISENREKGGMVGIPSGWPTLDYATSGYRSGNIYIYAARPKLGKSLALGYNCLSAYNAGYIPMLISMEMTDMEMALRLVAMHLGLNMTCLQKGQVSTFVERAIRDSAHMFTTKQPFYFVNGQFKKDVTEISSLVHGLKPDIVFIDGGYLVKMASSNAKYSRWEKMTEVAEHLKSLAMISQVPVVVSFQFNRQVKSNRPSSGGFETIQLADAIGQIASVGIGIYEEGNIFRRLEIMGGRQGETGAFTINWSWTDMNFTEVVDSATHPVERAVEE